METLEDLSKVVGTLEGRLLAIAALADTAADHLASRPEELVKTLRGIAEKARADT